MRVRVISFGFVFSGGKNNFILSFLFINVPLSNKKDGIRTSRYHFSENHCHKGFPHFSFKHF